jgi:teichuronic acid biosynthesis glycosyltransferase TuaC
MSRKRLRVLVLSELFPNPARPALGIFVERQTYYMQSFCENVVVAPLRVFPHLRLWKHLLHPEHFKNAWQQWRGELRKIPHQGETNGISVFFPRYISPPKQGFHGMWGFFAYAYLGKLLRAMHDKFTFDLIHAHYASPCGVVALLAQRWMKVPIVLSVHGADVTYTAKQNPISAAIIHWVFRNVDMVISNSSWTKQQVINYGADPDRSKIVYLGGNPEKETKLGDNNSNVAIILSVGYLEERKGHEYVLRSIEQLVNKGYKLKYLIVGDGPRYEYLKNLSDRLGISNVVRFEGYKSHAEVWTYFANCDIFVLPSWDEAFGVVYIEALGLGKPVIGCENEGGPEDIRKFGDCIEMVKPRDVDTLVGALKRLLDDPQRRHQMGEIGRKVVCEHFTWEKNALETFKIYEQVIDNSGS